LASAAPFAGLSADGGGRAGTLVALGAAAVSAALLLWAGGDPLFTGAFFAGLIGIGGLLLLAPRPRPVAAAAAAAREAPPFDPALLRAVLDSAGPATALALTDTDGKLVCANGAWGRWFGPVAGPFAVDGGEAARDALLAAARDARREGAAAIGPLRLNGRPAEGEVVLAAGGRLLWRLRRSDGPDLAGEGARLVAGEVGRRIGEAGMMLALVDAAGDIRAANPAFAARAVAEDGQGVEGTQLVDHLVTDEDGQFHLAGDGKAGPPLRIFQIPAEDRPDSLSFFVMMEDLASARISEDESLHFHALLDSLPLGLALADTDGRFTFLNQAFRKAAGLNQSERPVWPGDLVVDEDKAAVSDAVRRFGRGRALQGDLAVRLKANPEEPVAMTVAGVRGLGSATVLISLKDDSEEARLKREVAQATKMQAVGQLAGGVAHDFNNILTAILGTCDLMVMRHTPGDSDYDDIQQIRSNANRAANLTRQLLAFSRQQTLRPQVLQLPDVVAEVSHLLHRLLDERVKLVVKHGRSLGPVRADPGQLEQVIINLAVNARDAILARDPVGGGTLTLTTLAVSAEEVRRMGADVLPIADYTALKVSDTGTGIPPHLIGKIFEPFFTTKEVGKGTGLGLSTVYGIVKQSGGFIFAESQVRRGTTFTIYLPVHRAQPGETATRARRKEKAGELWGSGTVLVVEDEAMVRTVAERALTRNGYTVLTAEHGEAALEILAREKDIDLMISDVVMPTMDGPTMVRAARKTHPDLPILFMSGYAEEQLRKSIDMPNVAFLPKPFSVQQLAEAVHEMQLATARAKNRDGEGK